MRSRGNAVDQLFHGGFYFESFKDGRAAGGVYQLKEHRVTVVGKSRGKVRVAVTSAWLSVSPLNIVSELICHETSDPVGGPPTG